MDSYGLTPEGFKRKSYLKILEHMQSRAKELYGEKVNLTERSPLGMFLQAVAWEISLSWEELENSHLNNFSLYANGLSLDDAVANFGRVRFSGTPSVSQILVDANLGTKIPKGFIVSTEDGILFGTKVGITIQGPGTLIPVESLEIGVENNVYQNTITKIVNPIAGLIGVTNPGAATGGSNIESDDMLRLRNLEALREPATGDNISQYKLWVREVKGVGNLKVLPTTPTKGYVTIIIADVEGQPASAELVESVLNYINGVKPVNAGVYVNPATNKSLDMSMKVTLAEGYILQDIKTEIIEVIKQYFKDIALKESYISYAQVGRSILEVKGVMDYSELELNSLPGNVVLNETEVPTLGVTTIELM